MTSTDCYCDYDPPTIHSRKIVTARKQHRCDECAGTIMPGDKYEYVFGVWDGDASTFKTCERCRDIRQWVKNNVPCFCWYHCNMIEDAQEAINEACGRAPDETVGLRFGFLRRIVLLNRFNKARAAPAILGQLRPRH